MVNNETYSYKNSFRVTYYCPRIDFISPICGAGKKAQ